MFVIQHYFIFRPSDSTVSEDAGIEPWTVETLALTARYSNNSARSHPLDYLKLSNFSSEGHKREIVSPRIKIQYFKSGQKLVLFSVLRECAKNSRFITRVRQKNVSYTQITMLTNIKKTHVRNPFF
jgi:hypothetical protein